MKYYVVYSEVYDNYDVQTAYECETKEEALLLLQSINHRSNYNLTSSCIIEGKIIQGEL